MFLRLAALIFTITLASTTVEAQKAKKWKEALDNIEKSEFISTYKGYKERIEARMAEFHADSEYVSEKDVEIVKQAYIQSKSRFDNLLTGMKQDFTDKKMRRYISQDPDHYFRGFSYDLDSSWKYYLNECQKNADMLTSSSEGAFGLTEITLLLGLVEKFGSLIGKRMDNMKKMSGEYFESNLLSKLRLKDWETY